MIHIDRAGDASGQRAGQRAGKREAAGPAGHRQGFPTPPPIRPLPVRPRDRGRFPKGFRPGGGRPMAFRRGAWLAMPRIATPRAPGRKPWETVSMGHYQRDLVSPDLSRVRVVETAAYGVSGIPRGFAYPWRGAKRGCPRSVDGWSQEL